MLVYLIKDYYGNYKIGFTTSLLRRLDSFKVCHAKPLTIIHAFPTERGIAEERELQDKFKSKWISGEWFSLSDEDVNEIVNNHPGIDQNKLTNINNYLSCYHTNNFNLFYKEELTDKDLMKTIELLD